MSMRKTTAFSPARSVLIVDGDRFTRRALALILQLDDHAIRLARDGEEALAVLGGVSPDLVVSGWSLPGMAGEEFCRALRRHDPALPIVVVTRPGDGFVGHPEVSAHLPKPVDAQRLREVVRGQLGPARVARYRRTA